MINTCHGGFSVSDEAKRIYCERKPGKCPTRYEFERDDLVMVQIVKELGPAANGYFSKIELHSVSDKFAKHYEIVEYDGSEHVEIKHDAYKVDTVKAILKDETLTESQRIARACAVLEEEEEFE